MEKIRQIGEIITIDYPPSEYSTDTRTSRHTVKVIGHVRVYDYNLQKEVLAAKIETIKVEYICIDTN